MTTSLTCISCPCGCALEVAHDRRRIVTVAGHGCQRGVAYAEAEIFHPERMVTTTVRITHAALPLLPVKTSRAIPKDQVMAVLKTLAGWCVAAPVVAGQVLGRNIHGTGADIVATRSLPRT